MEHIMIDQIAYAIVRPFVGLQHTQHAGHATIVNQQRKGIPGLQLPMQIALHNSID